MNQKLKGINELIDLCDKMLTISHEFGYIKTTNKIYYQYCGLVDEFCKKHNLDDKNYAPYAILCKYWGPGADIRLSPSEIQAIKSNLILIKHTFFKDDYEKIFISHREADRDQVAAFVELLHAIGIPRATEDAPESVIFCTSHPEGYIKNGEQNLDEIRDMINTDKHVFYILWYTDRYFESPACLNEAGAIWAMKKKYQEILMSDFDSGKIRGLLDKQPVWFRANDKMRLNTFKEQIEKMFDLPKLSLNAWETARDAFIAKINQINAEKHDI